MLDLGRSPFHGVAHEEGAAIGVAATVQGSGLGVGIGHGDVFVGMPISSAAIIAVTVFAP